MEKSYGFSGNIMRRWNKMDPRRSESTIKMAGERINCNHLHMPFYFFRTFSEYPQLKQILEKSTDTKP